MEPVTDAETRAAAPPPGWRARLDRRAHPGAGDAMAGVAGALATAGLLVIAGQLFAEDNPRGFSALLCLAWAAGALALMRWGPARLRAAGTAALVLAVAGLWGFIVVADATSDPSTLFLFLTAASLLALFLVPNPARGRLVLLGVAALLVWTLVVNETADDDTPFVPYPDTSTIEQDIVRADGPGPRPVQAGDDNDDPYRYDDGPTLGGSGSDEGSTTTTGIVSLVMAAGFLGATYLLDRRQLRGLATAFVPAGLVAATLGYVYLAIGLQSVSGASLIAMAIGTLIALSGTRGERRFTTWYGALFAVFASAVFTLDLFDRFDADDTDYATGVTLLLTGVAVACGAYALGRLLGEPPDGGFAALPPAAGEPPGPAAPAPAAPESPVTGGPPPG